MIAQHLLHEWAKGGFKHENKIEWARGVAASLGASMLLAQVRRPTKIRPWKAATALALMSAAAVPWEKLLAKPRHPEGTPSYRDDDCCSSQEPMDAVDEAAMESFPASDPPARGHA